MRPSDYWVRRLIFFSAYAQLLKVKKALEKGDPETSRIYAQNAIRIKTTGLNYLRLSGRLDAVSLLPQLGRGCLASSASTLILSSSNP